MTIEDWGLVTYPDALQRQRDMFSKLIINPETEEFIVLAEHWPVLTLGKHGNIENLKVSRSELFKRGIDLQRIERGGDITFHGPGQLVVYPIINIRRHHLGVKQYIHLLEQSVIELLKEYDIVSSADDSAIGVWIDWGKPVARKICAIGVKISRGITMHGLAINVNTDLSAFDLINPCGFKDKGVTSMAKETGHNVDFDMVKQNFKMILQKNLH